MALTSAATTETAFVERANARKETTLRRDTVESSASATTLTAIAQTTSSVEVTVGVIAESVSVMLTTPAARATALWTPPPVWPAINRSVTAAATVNAAPVNVPTPSFRVRLVKSAQRALEFVLNTRIASSAGHLVPVTRKTRARSNAAILL